MESNCDEALRCLRLAEKFIQQVKKKKPLFSKEKSLGRIRNGIEKTFGKQLRCGSNARK